MRIRVISQASQKIKIVITSNDSDTVDTNQVTDGDDNAYINPWGKMSNIVLCNNITWSNYHFFRINAWGLSPINYF